MARTDRSRAPSDAQRDGSSGGKQVKVESETVQNSKGDGDAKPTYELKPAELEAVEAYRAAKEKAGPRLKVEATGKTSAKIDVDHPNDAVGIIALMRAIGTSDLGFYDGLIRRLVDSSREGGSPSQSNANFMLSVIKGIEPRDQVEAMLAAQMAAVHMASMTVRSSPGARREYPAAG